MRLRLYQFLVNRHPGISERYHKLHDNRNDVWVFLSWLYLLWLNFAYYVLFCKWLRIPRGQAFYEEKRLLCDRAESLELYFGLPEALEKYDVISFDIFDTLLYRPFSAPTDLFYLLGIQLEYMDFARIRIEAEQQARYKKYRDEKTYEVTLDEIWREVEHLTGINAYKGAQMESTLEYELCYANPKLLEIYRRLKKSGKRILYISDMYLPKETLYKILEKCGYEREPLFLSCELGKNKASGELFDYVVQELGENLKRIHLGDNLHSDIKMAKKRGYDTFQIMNPNQKSMLFRAHDMSPIIGGAYRGIVNNRLYCGAQSYSRYYEYGFIYGGLFVLGFCNFIHTFCKNKNIDKIFFIARDGEIINKVYNTIYPSDDTEYVYLSRTAGVKLSAGSLKYDYIRKMVRHKVNQGYSLTKILTSMELRELLSELQNEMNSENQDATLKWKNTSPDEECLTAQNCELFEDFLERHWARVLEIYRPQREAAGEYYKEKIGAAKRVVAVDIGWAGSGFATLRTLAGQEWETDCEILGIVAGTNTIHNAEPYMSEGFLQQGKLVSYFYSASNNRDLWKKHNLNAGYNLFLELLTSSDKPSFRGFYYDEKGSIKLKFQEAEENAQMICEIQQGILDFASDYQEHFGSFPYMLEISGRDAYAPIIVGASLHEKYLRKIYQDFELMVEVGIS